MTVLTTRKFATRAKIKGKPAITLPCEHAKKSSDAGEKCIKVGVLACIIDCEDGNKKAMTEMQEKSEERNSRPRICSVSQMPQMVL